MSDPAPIYLNDPLLVHFALQHDLRARFLEAIQDAIEALSIPDVEVANRVAGEILMEAIDGASIREWMEKGRPLSFIDQKYGKAAGELTQAVLALYEEKEASDAEEAPDA
jgi:hypothetical protein